MNRFTPPKIGRKSGLWKSHATGLGKNLPDLDFPDDATTDSDAPDCSEVSRSEENSDDDRSYPEQ